MPVGPEWRRRPINTLDDSETLSCSEWGVVYNPLDMNGAPPSQERSVAACQARCAGTSGCAHFAYYVTESYCHLQDAFASPSYQNPNWVSGPSGCSLAEQRLDVVATLLR